MATAMTAFLSTGRPPQQPGEIRILRRSPEHLPLVAGDSWKSPAETDNPKSICRVLRKCFPTPMPKLSPALNIEGAKLGFLLGQGACQHR